MSESYVLYQYASCPFCHMVRRFLQSIDVELPMRDTLLDPSARRELVEGGGRTMVPCLRIEDETGVVRWMYESRDIIAYLDEHLSQAPRGAGRLR